MAHECLPELERACAAGDLAVLKARILRTRRDFIAREPHRSFPATDGKLLTAITAAVEAAEAVLARHLAAVSPGTEDVAAVVAAR